MNRIHRNLHRHEWVLTAGGVVVRYLPECVAKGGAPVVLQGARRRALQRGTRTVHAYLQVEHVMPCGFDLHLHTDNPPLQALRVRYVPPGRAEPEGWQLDGQPWPVGTVLRWTICRRDGTCWGVR